METIKTSIASVEQIDSKNAEKERTSAPTRFMWIPGARPVIVPAKMPIKSAMISSINIDLNL